MGETHLDFHTVFIRYIVHLYTNDEFSTRNPFEASSQIVCRKSKMDTEPGILKVIRKFFLKHNKSFRWHFGDNEKQIFFSI